MNGHQPIKRGTRAECALVYALWDAENSVRLQRPDQYDEYLVKARAVMRWLRVHKASVHVR